MSVSDKYVSKKMIEIQTIEGGVSLCRHHDAINIQILDKPMSIHLMMKYTQW